MAQRVALIDCRDPLPPGTAEFILPTANDSDDTLWSTTETENGRKKLEPNTEDVFTRSGKFPPWLVNRRWRKGESYPKTIPQRCGKTFWPFCPYLECFKIKSFFCLAWGKSRVQNTQSLPSNMPQNWPYWDFLLWMFCGYPSQLFYAAHYIFDWIISYIQKHPTSTIGRLGQNLIRWSLADYLFENGIIFCWKFVWNDVKLNGLSHVIDSWKWEAVWISLTWTTQDPESDPTFHDCIDIALLYLKFVTTYVGDNPQN